MNKLKAVIIDDEVSTLKLLSSKVATLFADIEVAATFDHPDDALQYLEKQTPDLVFLDVEMPGMNGFELLTALTEVNFQLIFVTAYSEYALQALKNAAVDYILKPVDDDDLKRAVDKARTNLEQEKQALSSEALVNLLQETILRTRKVVVPTSKGMSLIPEDEVMHLEGYEGYTRLHLSNEEELISSYSLGKFQNQLGELFFKCHKSHIVNLESVRAFENEGYLLLENSQRVPISKTYRKAFLSLFGN